MPAVSRLGDVCSGHGCHPPRPSTEGSSDVFVNGIGVHRLGDAWASHTCGDNTHAGNLASGSSTVFANGLQVGRIADPINGVCGSVVAQGSEDVFAGG